MFKIRLSGPDCDQVRVEADGVLTPAEFQGVAKDLGRPIMRARKLGYVAARPARAGETVETRWGGGVARYTASAEDCVVIKLSPRQMVLQHHEGHLNIYLVSARHFDKLYEATDERTEFGSIYRAKGVQYVIHLPGGFDIGASWGERQVTSAGYLVFNGEDVYGNKVETFKATYAVVA